VAGEAEGAIGTPQSLSVARDLLPDGVA
jgi:hypothetical protein